MREYLVKHYGAIIVDEDKPENERREADDLCASWQWTHPDKSTCLCSIDKDLLQVPGHHLNFNKDQFQVRTLLDADLFFYYQLLVGDSVDNIAGAKGIGPKKAEQLIVSCSRKKNRVRKAVFDIYRKEFSSQWEAALDENATLLFLQRDEGKTWRDYFWH
jgi:5'-3' exonuclease